MPKFANSNRQPKRSLDYTALLVASHLAFNLVGCSGSNASTNATNDSGANTDTISDSGASTEAAEKELALDNFIEAVAAGMGMPGVQTVVIKDGNVVRAKSYGMAVIAPMTERPMTNDTILEFASISKEFVAVAFMQQVEAAAIGLDDDISASLPWQVRNPHFPDVPITWRMVLSHTSSINVDPRIFNDYILGTDSTIPLADFMSDLYTPTGRYYSSNTFLSDSPGTTYKYSTTAISLAAYAIELIVKQPFHEYVRQRIFEPLGMQVSSYFLRDLPPDLLAVGYTCNFHGVGFQCLPDGATNGTVLDQQHSVPQYPVLLLRSSALQYSKFMAMIMNDGKVGSTSIISHASIEQLLEPQAVAAYDGQQQGLVFFGIPEFADPNNNDLMWGHGGQDSGVATAAFFDRNAGVGAIVLGNSQDSAQTSTGQMTRIAAKLLSEFRPTIVDPPLCSVSDGLYCGDTLQLGTNTLYTCTNGRVTSSQSCPQCRTNPSGTPVECASTASCPFGNGHYCGLNDIGQDTNTLYDCNNGVYTISDVCAAGCVVNPPGSPDMCR